MMLMQTQYSHEPVRATLFDAPCFPQIHTRKHKLIVRAALNALFQELCLYPKPGLVSFMDRGSHDDMDASTFILSILSLRTYFQKMVLVGMRDGSFEELRCLGLEAESSMLAATENVNTHRGAIFTMGLLAAAAGFLIYRKRSLEGLNLGRTVQEKWGRDILDHAPSEPCSHGTLVACRYGVDGARQEAVAGFPHLFHVGLPSLREGLRKGLPFRRASLQSFFYLVAMLPDTNLLYRGGKQGLMEAQSAAQTFLDAGGVFQKNWQEQACRIHDVFVASRLSPGGSADLLAATLFVHQLQETL
jgi:triphosphoribosyl-dephospho-CoA synthase